jgi:hypothetical protein
LLLSLDIAIKIIYHYIKTTGNAMNSKQRKTLALILKEPTPSNIRWKDVEALFIHLGATLKEGNGSRIRITYKGINHTFHRPHPGHNVGEKTIEDIRELLKEAGIDNVEI